MPRLDHVPSANWRPSEMRSCWGSSSYAPRVRRPLLHRKLRPALPELRRAKVSFRRRTEMTDVLVIGAGPAGVLAGLRAADLGAQTALVTSGAFGSWKT